MDSKYEIEMDRMIIEGKENWRGICKEICKHPGVKFDPEWEIQFIPPFGGAAARFLVNYGGKDISVYLDWFCRLGYMPEPYYEIYPAADGDVARFYLYETDKLVDAIRESLKVG